MRYTFHGGGPCDGALNGAVMPDPLVAHAQGGCSLRRLRRRRRARRTGGRPSRRRARVAPVTGPSRNPVVNARVPARCSGRPRWLSAGERSG